MCRAEVCRETMQDRAEMLCLKDQLIRLEDSQTEEEEESMDKAMLELKLQDTSLAVAGQLAEAINQEACGL